MKAPLNTPKTRGYAPEVTRLIAHPFKGKVGRTRAGSPVLSIHRREPAHCNPSHRQLARVIYDVACRMEQISDELEARWVITAEPHNERIVVELADERESKRADEMVETVIAEFNLA